MTDKKRRVRNFALLCAAIAAGGALYYVLSINGISLPCISYSVFHVYCSGCGVTRMFQALVQLDFVRAFRCNAAFLITLPVWILQFAASGTAYIRSGRWRFAKWQYVLLALCALLIIAFGVVRNFEAFSFLRP